MSNLQLVSARKPRERLDADRSVQQTIATDHTVTRARGDDEDACEVRADFAYRATLTSAGVLTLVLARGVDDAARGGRYQR